MPDTDTTAAEGLERALSRARMVLRDCQGSTRRHGFCNDDLHHLVEAASRRAPTPPGGGEDERAIGELIDQRDAAERALSKAYSLVIGKAPEWSNVFGYREALNEIEEAVTPRTPSPGAVTPEELIQLIDPLAAAWKRALDANPPVSEDDERLFSAMAERWSRAESAVDRLLSRLQSAREGEDAQPYKDALHDLVMLKAQDDIGCVPPPTKGQWKKAWEEAEELVRVEP